LTLSEQVLIWIISVSAMRALPATGRYRSANAARDHAQIRLLIVGGTRFFGSFLTELALERGQEVTVLRRGQS